MIQDKIKYNFKLFLDELRESNNEFKIHKERLAGKTGQIDHHFPV